MRRKVLLRKNHKLMKLSEKIKALRKGAGLSLNQLNAVSTIYLPKDKAIAARCRGVKTRLLCDAPDLLCGDAPDVVEFNGFNSELTVLFE